ncbi:MAG TPA: succinate dehydrogenase cytochrome b subunit [Opitutales bacterium]|nr:succinate dehydrogenase cytochrome b subunit [Opitutales bacterium]
MQSGVTFFTSSIGRKIIMAVTGLILLGFVIGHMLGNLQIFLSQGQEQLNAYAHALQSMPLLLWTVRILLLAVFVLHIWVAVVLTLENMRSRPRNYLRDGTIQATYAARTMRWSGVIVLLFVIYHLLHFTVQVTNPEYRDLVDQAGRPDVYTMVIAGFSNFWISGFYIVAMLLLAMHLGHGIASLLQTLGLRNSGTRGFTDSISWIIAAIIFVGNSSIPLAVLFGYFN